MYACIIEFLSLCLTICVEVGPVAKCCIETLRKRQASRTIAHMSTMGTCKTMKCIKDDMKIKLWILLFITKQSNTI